MDSKICALIYANSKGIVCIVTAFKDLQQSCLDCGSVTFKL